MLIKRWPRRSPESVLRWARLLFNSPGLMNTIHMRGMAMKQETAGTVRGEWLAPQECASPQRVLLFLHGGGYVSCSPRSHRPITANLARMLGQRVFCLDYRLAPEHPFPAAVDDAAAAHQWLLQQGIAPHDISFAGDSAGGGLVLATLLRLRRTGVPLPASAVCISPWLDLTGNYPYRNAATCSMFWHSDVANFSSLYLNGASPEQEEASPLFGDLAGLPPIFTLVSSSEMLYDDALRLHEKAGKAGVRSVLRAYPGLPHDWPLAAGLIPEARQALQEMSDFVRGVYA
jgi:epsilon-lactone hydrolase